MNSDNYNNGHLTKGGCSLTNANAAYNTSIAADASINAAPISWRFMMFVQDIEIRDRIAASDINKLLYEYCTETMPKRSTQFLTVKNLATINQLDGCEECDLRVSLKPLRLNIDQDTLVFLIEFFTAFSKSLSRQQQLLQQPQSACNASGSSGGGNVTGSASRASEVTMSSEEAAEPKTAKTKTTSATTKTPTTPPLSSQQHQHHQQPTINHHHTNGTDANQQPIYIKSFTFSPDVPIRIDYHAKHLDFEQGALAGILMGLAHLDHSELVLRRVQAKHGMRGLDRVLVFALNSWLSDIKRNQLPSILSGVGPMHNVIQLFQGVRDLIWMPIDHYRKDGRLVRGLQRGASSFSSSTAMAAINLVNRFISIVQCTAQIAHDIVTPPSAASLSSGSIGGGASLGGTGLRRRHHYDRHHHNRGSGTNHHHSPIAQSSNNSTSMRRLAAANSYHHHNRGGSGQNGGRGRLDGATIGASSPASASGAAVVTTKQHHMLNVDRLNQPRNFCEGVAVGFNIIKEGFNDTARNVTVGMQAEDMRSAVGELVRQIPSTLLNPIISATEGAQSVLVGIRNQIAPDARREDQEKWKGRVRGK